jgi:hypothetical protein
MMEARSVSLDEARDMALRHLHEMERRRAESAKMEARRIDWEPNKE